MDESSANTGDMPAATQNAASRRENRLRRPAAHENTHFFID
jgi:hypothetical protein